MHVMYICVAQRPAIQNFKTHSPKQMRDSAHTSPDRIRSYDTYMTYGPMAYAAIVLYLLGLLDIYTAQHSTAQHSAVSE
jgi:hypothetical protein